MGLIQESAVIPERPNIRYYVIAIKWFARWKEYVTSSSADEVTQ